MSPTSEVQGYCLRWNNHHNTLISVLQSLYHSGSFVDVTLASEGKSLQVHRLVLCACSPYFQELLLQHWDKQAIIFLKDVPFTQLKALVDYMYKGEVNIAQDQLSSLLSTAESLQIKGLTDSDRDGKDPSQKMNNVEIGTKLTRTSDDIAESLRLNQIAPNMTVTDCDASSDSVTALVAQPVVSSLVPTSISMPYLNSTSSAIQQAIHQPIYTTNPMVVSAQAQNNTGMETGASFVVVEPKLETENDGEGSGGSGDEEDWSDTDLGPPTPHPHSSQGETVPQTFASTTPFAHVPWGESIAAAATGPPVPTGSQGSYIQGQGNAAPPGVNQTTIRGNARRPSRPPSVATLIQDKPYVCPRCGRCYSRRGALIQHQRYECGVEPQFSCPMCPYKIKRKDSLNRHIRNMHHNQSNS